VSLRVSELLKVKLSLGVGREEVGGSTGSAPGYCCELEGRCVS
jgi:hypothetical protein